MNTSLCIWWGLLIEGSNYCRFTVPFFLSLTFKNSFIVSFPVGSRYCRDAIIFEALGEQFEFVVIDGELESFDILKLMFMMYQGLNICRFIFVHQHVTVDIFLLFTMRIFFTKESKTIN